MQRLIFPSTVWPYAGSTAGGNPAMGASAADDGGMPLWRIAFSSDPHYGRVESRIDQAEAIMTTVDRGGYDALFVLGDIVEIGDAVEHWQAAGRSFARFTTPLRPIMGNHDVGLGGDANYRAVFFPDPATSDSGSTAYWSMRLPGVRIFALDIRWGSGDFDAAQRAWFIRELEATPKDTFVIVLSHCFFWSSGYQGVGYQWYDHPGNLRDIEPIFATHGVDLHLSGHNHYMEFLEANSVAYAVVGAMGGVPDPERTYTSPASRWFTRGTFGFVELAAYSGEYRLIFRDSAGAALYSRTFAASDTTTGL